MKTSARLFTILFLTVLITGTAAAAGQNTTRRDPQYDGKRNIIGYVDYTFDYQGKVLDMKNYDAQSKPALDADGVFEYVTKTTGARSELRFRDLQGKPITDHRGFGMVRTIMKNNRTLEMSTYDLNNHLKKDEFGVAKYQYWYSCIESNCLEKPQESAVAYVGEDGRRTLDGRGISKIQFKANAKVQRDYFPSETRFYGTDNKLKEDSRGIAMERYRYNGYGWLVETTQYGADGKLKADTNGVAVYRFGYNGTRIHDIRFLGPDLKPTVNTQSVPIYQQKYDLTGRLQDDTNITNNLPENVSHNPNGPVFVPAMKTDFYGIAEVQIDVDSQGQFTLSNFDAAGKPAKDNTGKSVIHYRYNNDTHKYETY